MIEGTDPVPDPVSGQAAPQEVERIAQHAVLAAGEVEAGPPPRRVPELAAFPLPDGVVRQDDVAPPGQVDVEDLVGVAGLADRRMPARAEDARGGRIDPLGPVEERGHVVTGEALEDELLDDVAVPHDLAGRPRRRRPLGGGKPADHLEERRAERRPQVSELGDRRDRLEPLPAQPLLSGREGEELLMEVVRRGLLVLAESGADRGRQPDTQDGSSRNGMLHGRRASLTLRVVAGGVERLGAFRAGGRHARGVPARGRICALVAAKARPARASMVARRACLARLHTENISSSVGSLPSADDAAESLEGNDGVSGQLVVAARRGARIRGGPRPISKAGSIPALVEHSGRGASHLAGILNSRIR